MTEDAEDRASAANCPLVVIIDDDYDIVEWCRIIFESAGFEASCFYTAETAYVFMTERKPDLVVTDLMMAHLDSGFDFVIRLKESKTLADVPVIMMTAAASRHGFDFAPRSEEDLAAMGVDAFFAKPADPKALVTKARALLARRPRG